VNTGERLVFLSGLSGVSAATHLLAIGLGATTGQALVDYSQLASATAEVHLLAEPAQSIHVVSGGTFEQANHEWEAKRKWRIEANRIPFSTLAIGIMFTCQPCSCIICCADLPVL